MRARLALLLAGSMLVAGCSDFGPAGPGKPECPANVGLGSIPTVIFMQFQALPDAQWGACINGLKVGWDYDDQEAERGRATFWLDSDRMGDRFVAVTLQESCNPGASEPAPVAAEGVERFVDVISETKPLEVVVVPVAPRHQNYATVAGLEVERAWAGQQSLVVTVVDSDELASRRIDAAAQRGAAVIVVDDREVAGGTIELRVPGEQPMVDLTPAAAAEELDDDLAPPSYVATWYNRFDTGCIVYDIDAVGQGAQTVAADLDDALGFYPLEELRELGRDAGFDI